MTPRERKTGQGRNTCRRPTHRELQEAERIQRLHPLQQRSHPAAVKAENSKLGHINTYGDLPDYYLDLPFQCRQCGRWEIWKARDQKWYYEEAKGHINSTAVDCHDCRIGKKGKD